MNMQNMLQVGFLLQINSTGRLVATVYALFGLISLIVGWIAVARARQRGGIVALVMGSMSIVLCGLHLTTATGDFGTGSGRLGAIVGLVVALVGTILGWKAMKRN